MNLRFKKTFALLFDIPMSIFCLTFLPFLKLTRKYGVENFPLQLKLFKQFGVFPIQDHYYEPKFKYTNSDILSYSSLMPFQIDHQIAALNLFNSKLINELSTFDVDKSNHQKFYVHNSNFGAGDVDLYYLMIRKYKSKRIIEIGSGFSTMVCLKSVSQNNREGFQTELTCIEPFEMPFLNQEKNISLIRKPVEDVGLELFQSLEENDILFIDSSHIIRPGNDLLHIFFEIFPILKKGVIIHIHDIFSPRHYPKEWLTEKMRFWNEQYLLEAFLHNNHDYKILFTANHLVKSHYEEAKKVLIHLQPNSEPSSFWMQKIN